MLLIGGSERAEEGDRISPLKGSGQALEQKYCLSAVLGDKCDPSANLSNQFKLLLPVIIVILTYWV